MQFLLQAGGHLYGELAWSTNGLNFSRVGEQPLFPNVGLPNAVYPELLSAGQVYPTSMLPSPAGDGSWLVYAAVASVQHGHGVDQGGDGWNCTGCSGISTYRIEKDRFVGLSGPVRQTQFTYQRAFKHTCCCCCANRASSARCRCAYWRWRWEKCRSCGSTWW